MLPAAAAAFRFTTDAFPEHQQNEAWQETFGRKVVGVETAQLCDMPFRVDLTVRALPGLTVIIYDHRPCSWRARAASSPTAMTA